MLPNDPNVFINALFHIGDYLSISPIIEAVKDKWPSSNIIVLCTKKNEDVVKYDTRITYICLPQHRCWYKYPNIIKNKTLIKADLLIEPASVKRPYRSIIGFILKPELTIGLLYKEYDHLQLPLITLEKHNVSMPETYSVMMAEYGFNKVPGVFKVFESKENNRIENILEDKGTQDYLIINPFASTKDRSLSISKSIDIINKLVSEGFNCALLLPPYIKNKSAWNRKLNKICDIFFVDSIQESIYLIKKSRGVVSVDTSVIHIASSYNIPTIGLYLPGDKFERKTWHPQSSRKHIELLSGDVEDIIKSDIFHS